ncbi:MAG: hypothetical protein EP318_14565 [Rhodobacteraceae bacterium]|nr:MAG: hypothetical protein EP318_14565 [Paracoccaceae bacterium]
MTLHSSAARTTPVGDEIACGSERHVYLLPEAPDRLLKVMRAKHLRAIEGCDDRTWRGWLRIRKAHALFRREQRAWSDAMLRASVRDAWPPLSGIAGLGLTPSGLGEVVERIVDAEGQTAPTLADLLHAPLSAEMLTALNAFVAALYDWHIPAYDLGPKNILWEDTTGRFVLVDGFGDRSVLPLKTWIRRLNDRRLDRAFAETAQKCPLTWNPRTRAFEQGARPATQ